MNRGIAIEITKFIGWMVLCGAMVQIPLFVAGASLSAGAGVHTLLLVSWGMFALGLGVAIALISGARIGFFLLYICTLLSFMGPRLNYFPFARLILPKGPESDYVAMGINLLVTAVVVICHLCLSRDSEHRARDRAVIGAFVIALIPGLIWWKTGVRIGSGECATIAETPLAGPYLAPLASTQPILYRSSELTRSHSGTVVFRGATSEANVREFAAVYDLKLMTNDVARVKFLPAIRLWNLDRERFPLYNLPSDLCYVGRVPKGSKMGVELCYRPEKGVFTAMAIGSPTSRAATGQAGAR